MPGPPPAVAAVRRAVRAELADLTPGDLVLAACSGGADSLALTAALAVEGTRLGLRCGAVTIDHSLQPGSDAVADAVVAVLEPLDLRAGRHLVRIEVTDGVGGPEASARDGRFLAIDRFAAAHGAAAVLLGHTLDDQAEQVLLGLARGSGARSLSGMPRRRGIYRRPLLRVTREQTHAACRAEGLPWWDDPHNADPAYARVRARRLLQVLDAELGPGVPAALARSADLLRADADHLDALADLEVEALGPAAGRWAVDDLARLPPAVRGRVWRRLLVATGAPAGQVSARHTDACDRLLTAWHGQGPIHVPGALLVRRAEGRVSIEPRTRVE